MASSRSTRRDFLKTSAAAAAAVAPTIVSPHAFAKPGAPAPSDRVVLGCIGTGDLGLRHHISHMLIPNKRIRIGAVCDVDRSRREAAQQEVFKKTGKQVDAYNDFRDLCDRTDLDAVIIVTPDHWHALCAIYAMEAGKDVYCEKPLTYAIEEGRRLVATARRYGTVFQTGSQQRSDKRFRQACELVRNGKIGKLVRVDTYIGSVVPGEWQKTTAPPPELDWNMWLGPAPFSEYMKNKVHYEFRWFADYSGGKMTDWGAHHNDIAQWAIGADGSGPVKVKGEGKFHQEGPHDVAANFDVVYTYANGVELHCHSDGENGVKLTGTDGWIFVNRHKIEASNPEILKYKFQPSDTRLYKSDHHHDNWLDCIASRKRPICDVEVGHRSVTVCHLGNIAIRLGRELRWDPATEHFLDDEEANRWTMRPMRAPWHL